jgi:hypothetical protein
MSCRIGGMMRCGDSRQPGSPRHLYGLFMSSVANASRSLTPSRAFDADQPSAAGSRRQWRDRDGTHSWMIAMLDFLMIAYGVGFFAISVLYVLACEKM